MYRDENKPAGAGKIPINLTLSVQRHLVNISGTPVGALIGGLSGAALSGISSAIGYAAAETQRAIDKANELSAEYKNLQKTIDANAKSAKGYAEEYENLSKGVDKNGRNISLTSDEYERYAVSNLVKTKPNYITIEDLNVSGMMKNKHRRKWELKLYTRTKICQKPIKTPKRRRIYSFSGLMPRRSAAEIFY